MKVSVRKLFLPPKKHERKKRKERNVAKWKTHFLELQMIFLVILKTLYMEIT